MSDAAILDFDSILNLPLKVNLAGKKLQELMKHMLSVDKNGKRSISQKEIQEAVMLIKDFAGKNTSSKFDKDATQIAVVNSIIKNLKATNISNSEPHIETREYDGNYDKQRFETLSEGGILTRNNDDAEQSSYSIMDELENQQDEMTDDNTRGEDSWVMSANYRNDETFKLDPSGHLQEGWHVKEGVRSVKQSNVTSGTVDRPIDIEKLLLKKNIQNQQNGDGNSRYYLPERSEILSMGTPVE